MQKTLLVTLDFYPQTGGVAQYWKHLGVFFDPQKWLVLAPLLPVGLHELTVPYPIYRRSFFSAWFFPRWFKLFFVLLDLTRKEQIEMVVVSHILPVGSVMLLIHLFMRTPYCVVFHGMDSSLPLKNFRKKLLCRLVLKNASFAVANSRYVAENLKKFGCTEKKIRIVYPCPSLDSSPNQAHSLLSRDILKKMEGKKVLLSISRLVERKGIEYVLKALPTLFEKYPDCVYVLVGDGPYRKILERTVLDLNISERVYFCGELRGEDVSDWYQRCNLFILTPHDLPNGDTEGFGIVYLEANSFGKPVIGSRCGGVPDAVIDGVTGLLVDQKSSDQIADVVVQLVSDTHLAQRLGQQGKRRVEKEFNWEQVAERYKELLA